MASTDVVVVGAGFAGLAAAVELERQGLEVTVLEARPRVGGKVESAIDATGRRVDTGGQYVCDDMTNVLDLIARQGKKLVTVDHDRSGQAFNGGGTPTSDPSDLWHTFEQAEATYAQIWELEAAAAPVATSLGDWLASLDLGTEVTRAARSALDGVMCMSVDDLPLTHVVDLARRTPLTRDELQYVVGETMHSVAAQLADRLQRPPRLSSPARSITVDRTSVVVRTDVDAVQARHAIVAVPPTAYRTISFEPRLPGATLAAAAAFRAGSVMKFVVRYDHAFWHRADRGPTAVWMEPAGLYIGDASLDGAPMLVAFLGGPATETWRRMAADDRRLALLDHLIEAYGPAAARPMSFVERDWPPDQWGGGGYWNVLVDAAATDAVEVLRHGAPGITFASTELAPSFPGYIEGAITAGRAAAGQVGAAMGIR